MAPLEGSGYADRTTQTDQLSRVAATLLFSANEERHDGSTAPSGVEGEFDADRHIAQDRAFIQTPAQEDGRSPA
jgi:hypothetical protein